jgi:hypothetical protein
MRRFVIMFTSRKPLTRAVSQTEPCRSLTAKSLEIGMSAAWRRNCRSGALSAQQGDCRDVATLTKKDRGHHEALENRWQPSDESTRISPGRRDRGWHSRRGDPHAERHSFCRGALDHPRRHRHLAIPCGSRTPRDRSLAAICRTRGANSPESGYRAALEVLDEDMPQYISDNTDDELSHAAFLNAIWRPKARGQ